MTDFCFLLSRGLLRLEPAAAEGCPWAAAVPRAVITEQSQQHTHQGSGHYETGESRKQKVIPQETSRLQQHISCFQFAPGPPFPARPGSSSAPALKCHSDSSVQTHPNSTPLTEILLGIRSIKICILQLLQFALLLFKVLC